MRVSVVGLRKGNIEILGPRYFGLLLTHSYSQNKREMDSSNSEIPSYMVHSRLSVPGGSTSKDLDPCRSKLFTEGPSDFHDDLADFNFSKTPTVFSGEKAYCWKVVHSPVSLLLRASRSGIQERICKVLPGFK